MWRGGVVERLQRSDEWNHRVLDDNAETVEISRQPPEVTHLRGRHLRQRNASGEGRGVSGVGCHPIEGREFAVGQYPEKLDGAWWNAAGRAWLRFGRLLLRVRRGHVELCRSCFRHTASLVCTVRA